MVHFRALVAGLAVAVLATSLIYGQGSTKDTTKNTKETPTKLKGYLPSGWSKLKLSTEQKQKVYKIRGEYRTKIDDLNKQIAALREKELRECVGVLNSDQKETLKKIVAGEPVEEKKKE